MSDVQPTAPPVVPVPSANLVPSAGTSTSSTPSQVSTPVKTVDKPVTRTDVLIRAGKTFLETAIPAILVIYNAGGDPVTERHAIIAALITAGSAAFAIIWNAGSIVFGARNEAKLQAAVNEVLAARGLLP
jgi:hypothetical protein